MEETHPHFNFNNEERIGEVTSHALTHLYIQPKKSATTSHIYSYPPNHSTNSRRSTSFDMWYIHIHHTAVPEKYIEYMIVYYY